MADYKKWFDLEDNYILAMANEHGDAETASWPELNPEKLSSLLYCAREVGMISAGTKAAILPDGSEFEIDTGKIFFPLNSAIDQQNELRDLIFVRPEESEIFFENSVAE